VARPVFTGRAANVDFAAGFIALIGRLPREAVFFGPVPGQPDYKKQKQVGKLFITQQASSITPEQAWTKENHWFG
jgi:hypothetical protein